MYTFERDIVLSKLPDVFMMKDGKRVQTLADWKRRRREILDSAVELQFGGMPPKPSKLVLETLQHRGKIHSYRINIYEETGHFSFPMQIYVPDSLDRSKKHPVLLTGDGCYADCNDEVIADALGRGWVVAKFNRVELAHDMYNTSRDTGIYPLYPDKKFSAISAWAWGYSRCMDALEEISYADETEVAITGHSRGGKAVMLAGATDERIAYVNPNNSGTLGCGPWRYRQYGPNYPKEEYDRSEHLVNLHVPVPYWMGEGMADYVNRDGEIPHDSHFFISLVAPRCFLGTEAYGDTWGNPVGTYHSHLAAKEVYKFLGVENNIHMVYREGGHQHGVADFKALLDYCDLMRAKKDLPEQYTRNPFPGLVPIFDWKAPLLE